MGEQIIDTQQPQEQKKNTVRHELGDYNGLTPITTITEKQATADMVPFVMCAFSLLMLFFAVQRGAGLIPILIIIAFAAVSVFTSIRSRYYYLGGKVDVSEDAIIEHYNIGKQRLYAFDDFKSFAVKGTGSAEMPLFANEGMVFNMAYIVEFSSGTVNVMRNDIGSKEVLKQLIAYFDIIDPDVAQSIREEAGSHYYLQGNRKRGKVRR